MCNFIFIFICILSFIFHAMRRLSSGFFSFIRQVPWFAFSFLFVFCFLFVFIWKAYYFLCLSYQKQRDATHHCSIVFGSRACVHFLRLWEKDIVSSQCWTHVNTLNFEYWVRKSTLISLMMFSLSRPALCRCSWAYLKSYFEHRIFDKLT